MSITSTRVHESLPPTAAPRKPRPTICEYNTTDVVGRAMITASIFGASKPVVNTPKFVSTCKLPSLKSSIQVRRSSIGVSPVIARALHPLVCRMRARSAAFSLVGQKTMVCLCCSIANISACDATNKVRLEFSPNSFNTSEGSSSNSLTARTALVDNAISIPLSGICQTSCPLISCGVSDFRGAVFVFGVEPDWSSRLPVSGFA